MAMPNVPVLFIHAFPLDARMWRPQVDAIGSERRTLAPDLRGFGGKKGGALPASIEQHARDLVDLLDRSTLPRAAVVGLSMGGYIAMAMHRLAPERIAGVLLADTKAGPDSPEVKSARNDRIQRLQREGVAFLPDAMLPGLVATGCAESTKLEVRRLILEQDPLAVAAALGALRDRLDSTPFLPSYRVPVTLVCGEHDTLTPPAVMLDMLASIPGADFVLIPGAGHLANWEAPDRFNEAMSVWLARVDAT